MDSDLRGLVHAALDIEPPRPDLADRVLAGVRRNRWSPTRSLSWRNPVLATAALVVFALAVAASLQGIRSHPSTPPSAAAPPVESPTKAIVAITARPISGALHVVDLQTGRVLRRLDTGLNPDVAVDWVHGRVAVLSTTFDVATADLRSTLTILDLATFDERLRVTIPDRAQDPGTGPTTLLVSANGESVHVLQRKVLGDERARVWLSSYDTASGALKSRIEISGCDSGAYISQGGTTGSVYVTCFNGGIHVINTKTERQDRQIQIPFPLDPHRPGWTQLLGASVSGDGSRYIAVSQDLRVFTVNLTNWKTQVLSRWQAHENPGQLVNIAVDPLGSRVWVVTGDGKGQRAITSLDLQSGERQDTAVSGVNAFALVGNDGIVRVDGGKLMASQGAVTVTLMPSLGSGMLVRGVVLAP
jgi:DNA-binding beta-propeller fold protein YncE